MDPNLLPNEFKTKEDKERARLKKQPVGFGLELNLPQKEKPQRSAKKVPHGPGFWSKFFGGSKPAAATEKLTMPAADYSHAYSDLDLLSPDKKTEPVPRPLKVTAKKNKSGWLGGLLGRPVSPIVGYHAEPTKANNALPPLKKFESEEIESTDVGIKQPAVPRAVWSKPEPVKVSSPAMTPARPGDSWGEILKNMFGFGRKQRIDFRLASNGASQAKPAIKTAPAFAPMPEIYRPASVKTEPSAQPKQPETPVVRKSEPVKAATKAKEDKKTVSTYHTVPKREKSSEVNVNLMPQEFRARLASGNTDIIKSAIIAVLAAMAIIAIVYGVTLWLQNSLKAEMSARQKEFDGLQAQLGDFVAQEKQNNQVADRVSAIKKLLDEKIIWNNFFTNLEKYTLDGVYFTNLTADTSGVLILPGIADNYGVLAKQIAAFRDAKDFIKDVSLTNAQLATEGKAGVIGVSFQLKLTLQDNVFKRTSSLK